MDTESTREWMLLPDSAVRSALSPRGKEAHILPLVAERMAPAIRRHGLKAKRGPYNEAILENAACRVVFSGLCEDRVHCRFSRKRLNGCKDFDLSLYLYVRFGDWALELLPRPCDDLDYEGRVLNQLDGFNALLLDGWLQEPLEGNFSWVADYRRAESEACSLLCELEAIKAVDFAAWAAIRAKLAASDHSWMNDARAFIEGHTLDQLGATLPPDTENSPVRVGVS